MDYSSILNAVNAYSGSAPGLSAAQINENYNAFQELQKQGVTIPSLMQDLRDLKAKVETLESKPREAPMDGELFAVMEAAVSDVPSVVEARRHAQEVRSMVLGEIVRQDPRYADALAQYRRAVNAAYVRGTSTAMDADPVD